MRLVIWKISNYKEFNDQNINTLWLSFFDSAGGSINFLQKPMEIRLFGYDVSIYNRSGSFASHSDFRSKPMQYRITPLALIISYFILFVSSSPQEVAFGSIGVSDTHHIGFGRLCDDLDYFSTLLRLKVAIIG